VSHVSERNANRDKARAEYLKNQNQPTPAQRGERPTQGGSARRVEERRRSGG